MVEPATYKGYDKEGNYVTSKTAENADNYIDLTTIKSAADNLKKVSSDEFNNIIKLLEIEGDASKTAITVQKMNMRDAIMDIAEQVKTYPPAIESYADETVTRATTAHDSKQTQLNKEAKDSLYANPDVESVS